MEENLLFDYLTISFKLHERQKTRFLNHLMKRLHFPRDEARQQRSFFSNFDECYVWNGWSFHWNAWEVCMNASGAGCRTIEKVNPGFGWYKFLHGYHKFITTKSYSFGDKYRVHISRLDVALDKINDKDAPFSKLAWYTQNEHFVCKATYWTVILGNRVNEILFGAPSSDRFLRIYDKKLEQEIEDDELTWLRFEFQMRNDNATSFYLNLAEHDGDYTVVYFGIMMDYLRFTTKKNKHDGNQKRLITCDWWESFIDKGKKIKQLYLPGEEYTIQRAYKYFDKACTSTMRLILETNGGNVGELVEMALDSKLNQKQEEVRSKVLLTRQNLEEAAAKLDELRGGQPPPEKPKLSREARLDYVRHERAKEKERAEQFDREQNYMSLIQTALKGGKRNAKQGPS